MSDGATTKRGPYASTRRRREEIARVVLDLVLERGHESVTVAEVAARASISEATMLYHFPSKDHLLVAALELSDQISSADTHAEELDAQFSPEAFRRTLSTGSRDDAILRLLQALNGAALTPGHPAAPYLLARRERQIAVFENLIARRQIDGFAHPGLDARRVAIQVLATWDGLVPFWLADPEFDLADVLIDAYRRIAGENLMELRAAVRERDFGL